MPELPFRVQSYMRYNRLKDIGLTGRMVRFIDATQANSVGGGARCATLSEPAAQA